MHKNAAPIAILLILTLATTITTQTNPTVQAETTTSTITTNGIIIYNQNQITFSGYNWTIRNQNNSNPGPNNYSNSVQNVWVDDNGYLHMKITCRDDKWYCPEVYLTQPLGYGTYTFHTTGFIDNLDKNVVLGLFVYKDGSNEIDIEYSRWGNDNYYNTGFTVQPKPYIENVNTLSFESTLKQTTSTHSFTWKNDSVLFETIQGNYSLETAPSENIIKQWLSSSSCNSNSAITIMNLWLYNGQPPLGQQPVEVIITGFEFTPL